MSMEEKKKEGYVNGIGCLVIFALFAYFAIMSISNTSAAALEGFFAALFGAFGFISLWKPDTWGAYISEYLKRLNKGSEERSDSRNTQIQQDSDGSVQVIGDRPQINVNIPKEKQASKSSTMAKTFSCPRGHGNTVYPPDDNHPMASSEEGYAQKYALGTVKPIPYTCEICGIKFTLYWYQGKSRSAVLGRFGEKQ